MRIEWEEDEQGFAFGKINGITKYYVGYTFRKDGIVADTKYNNHTWRRLDVAVSSMEDGIQICEMWEATGAY